MFSKVKVSGSFRAHAVRRWTGTVALLLFSAGCRSEGDRSDGVMRPVEPPPGVISTATATVGQEPMFTTAGSPSPYPHDRETFEPVTIGRGKIVMRSSLPAINVPFRIRNEDAVQHVITLRATSEKPLAQLTLAPRQEAILVVQLRKGEHQVICTLPAHNERASFNTYVPR